MTVSPEILQLETTIIQSEVEFSAKSVDMKYHAACVRKGTFAIDKGKNRA